MDVKTLLESITPEIYENLKTAIELGKWADGRKLDQEQKELCMQAVIAYEQMHVPAEERTGYIPPKPHSHCGGEGDVAQPDDEKPIRWH